MVDQVDVIRSELAEKALNALILQCRENASLQNDKSIQIIINMGKKMGIKKDNIPRIIPLTKCKLFKPRDLNILLITKDPSTLFRETLTKDEHTSELFKEIISCLLYTSESLRNTLSKRPRKYCLYSCICFFIFQELKTYRKP